MAHALLSPSSAHRWLRCTASPRLEAKEPDRDTSYSMEGTLAHAWCAKKLKTLLGQPTMNEDDEIARLSHLQTGEMGEYTDTYVEIVTEKWNEARALTSDAELLVEVRLDFSDVVPDSFGTADAVIIADGTMEVVDFKYGKGVRVEAFRNPQMMIYALGAYRRFSFEYRIEKVRMTIVQPRIDNLSEWKMDVADLLSWREDELRPAAEEAYRGDGRQEPGAWCQFCKVKSRCRALADTCLSVAESDPRMLSAEELASTVLPRLATTKTWLTGVEEYTLQQALDGVVYPGFKVVEGRSVRRITDSAAVMDALAREGYRREDFVRPTELRSLTDLERAVGKKRFAELCGQWLEKPQGKPTLAPESDKRPAFNSAADDFRGI